MAAGAWIMMVRTIKKVLAAEAAVLTDPATYSSLAAGSYAYYVGSGGGIGSPGGNSSWNTPNNQSSYDILLTGGGAGSWELGGGMGGTVLIGTGYSGGYGRW